MPGRPCRPRRQERRGISMVDPQELFAGSLAGLVFLAIGHLIMRLTSMHKQTLPFQFRVFTIALLVRFGLSIVIYQLGFAALLGDADGSGWGYGDTLWKAWETGRYGIVDVIAAWKGAFEF